MNTRRSYDMHSRGVAAEATRERLLGCGQELFLSRWYDEVTIAVVAREAGVSSQTLLNHFGSKENLFAEVVKRLAAELNERRDRAESADIAGAVAILVDDYEITGDATIRLLAIEERIPALGEVMAVGREGHRAWVQRVFGTVDRVNELVVITDVYAWKLLRRDRGLSAGETAETMLRMAEAVLSHTRKEPTKSKRSPA